MQQQQDAPAPVAPTRKARILAWCWLAYLAAPAVLAFALWVIDFYAEPAFIDLATRMHPLTAPIVALMKLPAGASQTSPVPSTVIPDLDPSQNPDDARLATWLHPLIIPGLGSSTQMTVILSDSQQQPQRNWISSPRLEMDDFAIAADIVTLVIQVTGILMLAVLSVFRPWPALLKSAATTRTTKRGKPVEPGAISAVVLCLALIVMAMLFLSSNTLRDMELTHRRELRDFPGFLYASARLFAATGFCFQLGVVLAILASAKARLRRQAASNVT